MKYPYYPNQVQDLVVLSRGESDPMECFKDYMNWSTKHDVAGNFFEDLLKKSNCVQSAGSEIDQIVYFYAMDTDQARERLPKRIERLYKDFWEIFFP